MDVAEEATKMVAVAVAMATAPAAHAAPGSIAARALVLA